jgi:hypothetical protein
MMVFLALPLDIPILMASFRIPMADSIFIRTSMIMVHPTSIPLRGWYSVLQSTVSSKL